MNRYTPVSPSAYCRLLFLFLLLLAPLSSCRRLDERMEIKETRPISAYAAPVVPVVPSQDRFANAEPPEPEEPPPTPAQKLFAWVTPEGWRETDKDPSGMRFINLQFGPNNEGECYLSLMPGKAGGVEANINRWRAQMSQPAYTAEELAKLPKKPLLSREATLVTIDGDFRGVGANEAAKNYRLVGLVLAAPQATLFVKMTGPKDLVEKNMPSFEQFIDSVSPAR